MRFYFIRASVIFLFCLSFLLPLGSSGQKVIIDFSEVSPPVLDTKLDSVQRNLIDSLIFYDDSDQICNAIKPKSRLKYLSCSCSNANGLISGLSEAINLEELTIQSLILVDTIPDYIAHFPKLKTLDIPFVVNAFNIERITQMRSLNSLSLNIKSDDFQALLSRLPEIESLQKLRVYLDSKSLEQFYQISGQLMLTELTVDCKSRIDLNKINIKSLQKLKIRNKYHLDSKLPLSFADSLRQMNIREFEKKSGLAIIYNLSNVDTFRVAIANVNVENIDCSRLKKNINIILGYSNKLAYRDKRICSDSIKMIFERNEMTRS